MLNTYLHLNVWLCSFFFLSTDKLESFCLKLFGRGQLNCKFFLFDFFLQIIYKDNVQRLNKLFVLMGFKKFQSFDSVFSVTKFILLLLCLFVTYFLYYLILGHLQICFKQILTLCRSCLPTTSS